MEKLLNFAIRPYNLVFKTWRASNKGSFRNRLRYDAFERPHYAFCLFHAAREAHKLGHEAISVAEFGVAGGRGLLALEDLAEQVEREFPVRIDIWGFDTGEGLPEPVDYRDMPHVWQAGHYRMDQAALKARLKRARLVLGDVADTVPTFFEAHKAAPIGAAFLDLDFWSSTLNALKIFEGPHATMLPRVFCYFDDVVTDEYSAYFNDYVGQLAAIRDYNGKDAMRKVTPAHGLHLSRQIPAKWPEQIYLHHAFDHPAYNTYILDDEDRQLPV